MMGSQMMMRSRQIEFAIWCAPKLKGPNALPILNSNVIKNTFINWNAKKGAAKASKGPMRVGRKDRTHCSGPKSSGCPSPPALRPPKPRLLRSALAKNATAAAVPVAVPSAAPRRPKS